MSKYKSLMACAIVAMLSMAAVCRAEDGKGGKVTLLHDDMDSLQLRFVPGALTYGETGFAGERFATLTLDGYVPSSEVGCPALPLFSQLIEVPLCRAFEVKVSDLLFDTLDAPRLPLLPAQPPRRKSDTSAVRLTIDRGVYAADSFYAIATALVEPVGVARDRNLARLQFSPVRYNPVSRKLIVCRQATVTVVYRDADASATKEMYDRYHTPAFQPNADVLNSLYPKSVSSSAPVRYLIVAHSMFREHLDSFVQWKQRKGFLVDVAYTDNANVGTTTTSIAAYIKSQYLNATAESPAPTYLLLVGDVEQIPAFEGTTNSNHVTDLYYTTWTDGDNVPDCYHGRFSAQNVSQLTPQIEKTLMYEQYTFADPTFLDRAVMVAGVDGGTSGDNGYTYGDPSMDYAITNYINGAHGFQQVRYFKNNTSIVPAATNVVMGNNASSNSAFVRSCYNEGAGLINYTAHGSPTCWGTPYLGVDNVPNMTNYQKFGLMIGNCCQSSTFTLATCFGEALLRQGNYCGAVGYIGASNNTYWTYDFYWTVGARSNVGPNMSMAYTASDRGAYDYLCHTHGERYALWATTQAALMMAGNMSVVSKVGSNSALYYWEIYHLMGDPSLMPYLTQAQTIDLDMSPIIASGTATLQVTAVPYAYVALTDSTTHSLMASAFAGANGVATLALPSTLPAGSYEVTASAQQHRTVFRNLQVVSVADNGACVFTSSIANTAPLTAGATAPFDVEVENIGAAANNVVVQWTSDNPHVSFASNRTVLLNIGANQTVTLTAGLSVIIDQQVADGTRVNITATTQCGSQSLSVTFPVYISAPVLVADCSNNGQTILPGADGTVAVTLSNVGHAPLPTSYLRIVSPTSLFTASAIDTTSFTLAPGGSVTRQYTLHADSQLPQGIMVPLRLQLDGFYNQIHDTVGVFTASPSTETFEGGSFHYGVWNQGGYPWTFTSAEADGGSWSLRSNNSLGNNQSSDVTLQYTFLQADSIYFRYKVSSEGGYDMFYFYIDNEEQMEASGTVDWTSAAFPVAAGSHSLRFAYTKDRSVAEGSDCAWIDNIVLPPLVSATTFLVDTFCVGMVCVIDGDTLDTSMPTTGTQVSSTADGVTMRDYVVLTTIHVDTMLTVCDSLRCGEQLYTESGVAEFTVSTAYGCDSSVTLQLTVKHSSHDTVEVSATGSSYLWENDVYFASGEYDSYHTNAEGCDSVITLRLTLTSGQGIDDAGADLVQVYPSPTTGWVHFSSEVVEVVVYDVSGRMLQRLQHAQKVDLSTLPAGFYTLRLTLPKGSATCRVVKR